MYIGGKKVMNEYEKKEVMRYLIDNIPVLLDIDKQDLKYDVRDIHYKIYKYIKELQEDLKTLQKRK